MKEVRIFECRAVSILMSEPDAVGLVSFLASCVVSPPNPPSPGWLGPAPFMSCERGLRIGRVSGRFMSAVLYLSQSHVRIDRLFCFLVCFGFVEIPANSLMTIEELVRNEIELALMALGSLPWAEHQVACLAGYAMSAMGH